MDAALDVSALVSASSAADVEGAEAVADKCAFCQGAAVYSDLRLKVAGFAQALSFDGRRDRETAPLAPNF